MSAQELIVGAYVVTADSPEPRRVDTIETDRVWLKCTDVDEMSEEVKLDNLRPVPITPELLIRAGFTFAVYRWLLRVEPRGYQVWQTVDGAWAFGRQSGNSYQTRISGLHHLQQLLYAFERVTITLTPTPEL